MKIIVAGAGSVGTYLIDRLSTENHDLVVIDLQESILEKLTANYDIRGFCASASSLENLRQAGAEDADVFIAATDSDETNLISCLLAESISSQSRKLARVREIVTDDSGLSENVASVFDAFINPDRESVSALLRLFKVPGAVEVMEFGNGEILVVGVFMTPGAPLAGIKLRDLPTVGASEGMLVVAINRDGQLIIPTGNDELAPGDEVYVAALPESIDLIPSAFGSARPPVQSVMIFGGGSVGAKLASALAAQDVKVKLIESDPERCAVLAARLQNVLVLNGDGTDQEILRDESIAEIDMFVGTTGDEEENILAALLAKRLGAKSSAVIVTKSSYLNLITEIGIDIVVSPHIAAASKILKFVRKGSVSSAFSTRDDSAEVLEFEAVENSPVVGVPLRDLKLPAGVIVAGIHGEDGAVIPKGDTTIAAGNRVIFFASRKALPKLQSLVAKGERNFAK